MPFPSHPFYLFLFLNVWPWLKGYPRPESLCSLHGKGNFKAAEPWQGETEASPSFFPLLQKPFSSSSYYPLTQAPSLHVAQDSHMPTRLISSKTNPYSVGPCCDPAFSFHFMTFFAISSLIMLSVLARSSLWYAFFLLLKNDLLLFFLTLCNSLLFLLMILAWKEKHVYLIAFCIYMTTF